MPHTLITIDARRITGWGTFHDLFTQLFGFPESYSRNMNSWMNAMAKIDDPASTLAAFHIPPNSLLVIQLDNVDEFAERFPQQYNTIVDCVAIVNIRRIEAGGEPVLALAYFKN